MAVNTAMHAAVAGRPMQPSPRVVGSTGLNQGNSQPGFPPRPLSETAPVSSLSYKPAGVPEAGTPGQHRTDYSPDTTTKDLIDTQNSTNAAPSTASFLAYKAGEVLTTIENLVSTASAAPLKTSSDKSEQALTSPDKLSVGKVVVEESLHDKLLKNLKPEAPSCDCFSSGGPQPDSGPY